MIKTMKDPISIKKFADLTGIDKETIRFYRDKGLLNPQRKEENSYTCYGSGDFMDLYNILRYRDMGISIRQIRQLLHGEDLDAYEARLDGQIIELEEELLRLRRKLFRLKNASRYLKNSRKQNKWIEYQEDGMALYTLWMRDLSLPQMKDLLTRIPGSYIGINIPLHELKNGPPGGVYSSCIGVGISEPSIEEYGYSDTDGLEYTSPGPVLKYYLRLKNPLEIKEEDMRELIAYSRREGYELIDHTTGYLFGTEMADGEQYYYFLIRVRVTRRECHGNQTTEIFHQCGGASELYQSGQGMLHCADSDDAADRQSGE